MKESDASMHASKPFIHSLATLYPLDSLEWHLTSMSYNR